MMTKRLAIAVLAMGLLPHPAIAHHGDAARYGNAITTISGRVVAMQLVNPHSVIILDVTDESGKTVRWQAEMTGAGQLARMFGWTRTTLQPGDEITVTGRRIRSGAPYLNLSERARIVRTSSGEELYRTEDYQAP